VSGTRAKHVSPLEMLGLFVFPYPEVRMRFAFMLGFALIWLPLALFAQGVEDPTSGIGAGALAYGLSELVKWAIPLIGAFLFSTFNKVGGFVATWPNAAKQGFYIALSTGLMYVGEFLHVTVSNDPANWGGTFWEGLAAGLVGTLLVKLGIGQARDPESATARVG
jgi:hypothetical protein